MNDSRHEKKRSLTGLRVAHRNVHSATAPKAQVMMQIWNGFGVILILSLFSALIGVQPSSAAAEFELSGEANYDLIGTKGEILTSIANEFQVAVRGDRWRIVTWPKGTSNRLDCASDSITIRTLNSQFRVTSSNSYWANAATVEKRDSPLFDDPFLQTLWFAFCSKSYLDKATNGMIEPIWTQDDSSLRRSGYRCAATWTLDMNEPGLLLSATFLNDGFYRGYDRSGKPTITKLSPPWQSGYTSAVYVATSITNVGILSIPTEFHFRTFFVPIGKGISPDMPRDTLVGRVRAISPTTLEQSFFPQFTGEISIHDYRFADKYPKNLLPEGFATYKSSAGKWPEGKELDLLVYKYTRSFLPHPVQAPRRSTRWRNSTAKGLLAIGLCAPVAFFLWKTLRTRSSPLLPSKK